MSATEKPWPLMKCSELAMPPLDARYIEPKEWDKIAVQFRDVLHEQSQCFNELRWAPQQLERIAFYQGGVLVSGAIVLLIRIPLVNVGIAVVKWGPLWRKKDRSDTPDILNATVLELKKIYAIERRFFLSFFPRADPEISELEEEVLGKCGFYPGEELDSPERYFVNTGIPLEQLRASMSQKWRYNLKKAEKNALTHRYVTGRDGAQQFMALYQEMMRRKAFHDTSAIDTLKELMNAEEESLRPLILVVDQGDKPIAGGVVDASGERAIYLYGATSDEALALNAGYKMHWEFARRLSADPFNKWYDLGGADCASNLGQFKRGFVGKRGITSITPRYYHFGHSLKVRFCGESLFLVRRTKGRLKRYLHDFFRRKRGF